MNIFPRILNETFLLHHIICMEKNDIKKYIQMLLADLKRKEPHY